MNSNSLKTVVLLAALGGICIGIGRIFGTGGMMIGFIVALAITGGSYWFSDKMAIRAAGARLLEEGELPWLRRMVSELAQGLGMPMPRLYVAPSPQPNAFATGRNPQNAAVAVTAGILEVLDQEELRGVLAHEMAHVRNRDILLTSIAASFGTAISLIANFLPFGMMGGDEEDRPNPIIAIVIMLLAPLAAMLCQLALSRSREFQADATGARMLHDGEPLARALMKIDAYAKQIPMNVDRSQASAYIINPIPRSLFSTHPSTEDRVARLRQIQSSL